MKYKAIKNYILRQFIKWENTYVKRESEKKSIKLHLPYDINYVNMDF